MASPLLEIDQKINHMHMAPYQFQTQVVTTWRSGSTFLGDILASHPATFYHYEPLIHLGITQVRSGKLAETALKALKSQLNCSYNALGKVYGFCLC